MVWFEVLQHLIASPCILDLGAAARPLHSGASWASSTRMFLGRNATCRMKAEREEAFVALCQHDGGETCSKCMEYHGITTCRPLPPETTNKAWRKLHHFVSERHCSVNALGVLCEHILSKHGFNTQTVAVGPRARFQRTLTSDSHFRGTGALLPFMARSEAEYSMVTDVDVAAQRMDVATPNPFELMRWLDLKIQSVGAVGVGCMYNMSEISVVVGSFHLALPSLSTCGGSISSLR